MDKNAEPPLLRNYIVFGVAAYLLVLIATIPAGLAWSVVSEHLSPFKLETEQATIWRGKEKPGQIDNIIDFKLDWKWNPLALFNAGFGYFLNINNAAGTVQANVLWRPYGNIIIKDARGSISLEDLTGILSSNGFFQTMPFAAKGRLLIDNLRLNIQQQWPEEIEANISLNNLEISGMQLTSWTGRIHTLTNGDIVATFKNIDAFLTGKIELQFSETGSLNITWNIKETGSTPADMIKNLSLLGETNAAGYRQGSYRVAWK